MTVLDFAAPAAPAIPLIDSNQFKTSMRSLAGAVSVITVGQGDDRSGFTATSVSALSVDPPSVLVTLNRESSSWPIVQRHGAFAVNILAGDQHHLADRFAGRNGVKGIARYEGAQWRTLVTGTLTLANALTVLDCELEEAIGRHSHAILIGRVRSIASQEAQPLLYWHGAYRQFGEA